MNALARLKLRAEVRHVCAMPACAGKERVKEASSPASDLPYVQAVDPKEAQMRHHRRHRQTLLHWLLYQALMRKVGFACWVTHWLRRSVQQLQLGVGGLPSAF